MQNVTLDALAETDVDAFLDRLHLGRARRVWRDLVERAERERWPYRALLHSLLVEEVDARVVRAVPRRPLSPRERDVLGLLLEGHSEKLAADRLGISTHTVHQYVKALFRAYGVSSRAELMALFIPKLRDEKG